MITILIMQVVCFYIHVGRFLQLILLLNKTSRETSYDRFLHSVEPVKFMLVDACKLAFGTVA